MLHCSLRISEKYNKFISDNIVTFQKIKILYVKFPWRPCTVFPQLEVVYCIIEQKFVAAQKWYSILTTGHNNSNFFVTVWVQTHTTWTTHLLISWAFPYIQECKAETDCQCDSWEECRLSNGFEPCNGNATLSCLQKPWCSHVINVAVTHPFCVCLSTHACKGEVFKCTVYSLGK